jgi:hypothetical protein
MADSELLLFAYFDLDQNDVQPELEIKAMPKLLCVTTALDPCRRSAVQRCLRLRLLRSS